MYVIALCILGKGFFGFAHDEGSGKGETVETAKKFTIQTVNEVAAMYKRVAGWHTVILAYEDAKALMLVRVTL